MNESFPSDSLYREFILEHYQHPHNFGELENPTARATDVNPLCGDRIQIDLHIEADRIQEVRFMGNGCAISQASASLLTDLIRGKTLEEVRKMTTQDILTALMVPVSPARLKCALLSLKVAKLAVYAALHEKPDFDAFEE